MKYVASQTIPAEYKPQMLLQSACTGKDVWFVSYDPRMGEGKDLFVKKYRPTPEEIAEVEKAAEQFLAECDALFDFFNTKLSITKRMQYEHDACRTSPIGQ
jgi:hypothetical protein